MRLEGRAVREHLCDVPHKRIGTLLHLEGDATRLCAGQADVFRKEASDEGGLGLVSADQLARKPDHSHSIVPGGFDVMS